MLKRIEQYHFSVAHLLGWLLNVIAWIACPVMAIPFWAEIRGVDLAPNFWTTLWAARTDGWLYVTIVLSVALAFQPGKLLLERATGLNNAEGRCNHAVRGLHAIADGTKRRNKVSFLQAYESLLQAASIELGASLRTTAGDELRTNLLLVAAPNHVRVVARSRPGSPIGVQYSRSNVSASAKAMANNQTVVENSIDAAPTRGEQRRYKTVVAVPVARGGRCFGAITADSCTDKIFSGNEAQIERILLPYAAAILLTLLQTDEHVVCPERYE